MCSTRFTRALAAEAALRRAQRFATSAIVFAVMTSAGGAPALALTWGFDFGVEEWRVVSYPFRGHNPMPATSPASHDLSFGSPAGSIRIGDVYAETGISAPDSVLGNRLDLYGTELSYDIFIRFTDSAIYPAVSLNGGSTSVYYDRPSPQLNAWEHVTIPLNETGWRVAVSQLPATQSQFQSVLSTLNGLYLYTEWHTGADDTNVDNVVLGAMNSPLGDYNEDGTINAADYTVYRNRKSGIGGTTLPNDAGALGVTIDDFNYWKAHFGETYGSGAAVFDRPANVPEPASLILACLAYCGLWKTIGRRNRN
jgi:hypothetical protein